MTRKTNRELITEFAELVTVGAQGMAVSVARKANEAPHDIGSNDVLEATKEWRAKIWAKLKEIEERLCPMPPDPPADRFIERCP